MASATSDYSVCTTWGRYEGKWYLLDLFRKRMDFTDLKEKIIAMRQLWSADRVIIEADGSGRALSAQIHKEGHQWVKSVRTGNKSKEVRLIDQSARLISGDYVLPSNAKWFRELRREFMAFPAGNYDDQVDSISQFVAWINSNIGRGFLNKDLKTGRRLRPRRGRQR